MARWCRWEDTVWDVVWDAVVLISLQMNADKTTSGTFWATSSKGTTTLDAAMMLWCDVEQTAQEWGWPKWHGSLKPLLMLAAWRVVIWHRGLFCSWSKLVDQQWIKGRWILSGLTFLWRFLPFYSIIMVFCGDWICYSNAKNVPWWFYISWALWIESEAISIRTDHKREPF